MSNTVIVYGICADNNDPWGVGRIRVIIDDKTMPSMQTGLGVEDYIKQLDEVNLANKGNNAYKPWELGIKGRAPDPYTFEPFLPKHVNVIPKIGESVKIIYYTAGDEVAQREYIAPHTSNYDKLYFDGIQTARGFSKRTTFQPQINNLRKNGLVPDPTDIALLGRKNSDIVLPEGEVIIRAGHQNFPSPVKNVGAALLQASHFPQRKIVVTQSVPTDDTPAQVINYMVEISTAIYDVAVDPFYIATDIMIYPVQNVDTKNYNLYKNYLGNDNAEFLIRVKSNSGANIANFIDDLLRNLDNNHMPLSIPETDTWVPRPDTNPLVAYSIADNRSSEDTAVESYNLFVYQVRNNPESNFKIEEVSTVADGVNIGVRPLVKRATQVISDVEQDVTINDPTFDETVIVAGADKMFLLSWLNAKNIQNSIGKYGFSQDKIYTILQANTEAMVKGDTLLKLLLDILDLVENHGHATGVDPIGSLNTAARTKIANIKDTYALNNPVTKDLGGGSKILNQYLRLD